MCRGRNPGGNQFVVADAPFPPMITSPWTIVRYGQANEQSQGGNCSSSSASRENAGEGTMSTSSGSSASTSTNSSRSSNIKSNRSADAGSRINGSVEGAICVSFCAYYEVGVQSKRNNSTFKQRYLLGPFLQRFFESNVLRLLHHSTPAANFHCS